MIRFIRSHSNPILRRLAWLAPACIVLAAPAAETPLVAIGVTEPIFDVTLSTAVPGIISVQKFKEGDAVKAGDVILELDKRIEELEVDRRNLVVGIRKMDLDATQVLYEKTKSVSKEELDKKRVDYAVAVVEHQMAVEALRRRLIPAPQDGIITDVLLDVGEAADAYQPVVRMVDPRRCRFECNVEAHTATHLALQQTIRLDIDTGATPQTVTGTVAFISPVADPASGLINVKVQFDNPDGRIRPGLPGKMVVVH